MNNEWYKKHIASIEYHRDYCLADADLARLDYRKYGLYEDFKRWKESIREAWRFRKMIKENKGK